MVGRTRPDFCWFGTPRFTVVAVFGECCTMDFFFGGWAQASFRLDMLWDWFGGLGGC